MREYCGLRRAVLFTFDMYTSYVLLWSGMRAIFGKFKVNDDYFVG